MTILCDKLWRAMIPDLSDDRWWRCVPNARQSTSLVSWSAMKQWASSSWSAVMKLTTCNGRCFWFSQTRCRQATSNEFNNIWIPSGWGQWSNVLTRLGRKRTSGQELTACKSTRTEVDSVTWIQWLENARWKIQWMRKNRWEQKSLITSRRFSRIQ